MGVINLNTLELMRLEINATMMVGSFSKKPQDICNPSIHLTGENSYAHAYIFSDSGYARVQLANIQYNINRNALQSKPCQRCPYTASNLIFPWDTLAEYSIVGLADRTIHPLVCRNVQFTTEIIASNAALITMMPLTS